VNLQQAPYPDELADLVANCTLDPGWVVALRDVFPLGEITRTDQRTMYTGEVLP